MPVRLAVLLTLVFSLALPAAASALDGGGARWEPGTMLVRFGDRVGAAERVRIAERAGARLDHALPLVPNLWELSTAGKVEDAVARLESGTGVVYAQPNYLDNETEDDLGPDSTAYWPNDPYFWPRRFADPNKCGSATAAGLGSWQFWPFGQNLTDPTAPAAGFSPPPFDQQLTQPWGSARYAVYNSVNVLPVWNLLRLNGRLGGPPNGGWTNEDLTTEGVGVIDTGIAPHPDLNRQIAAEWSVVTSRESEHNGTSTRTRVREVYADAPLRDDVTTVRDAIERQNADRSVEVQEIDRPLFRLDDVKGFGLSLGRPEHAGTAEQLDALLGCEGHGTAVASLLTARGGNGIGTVGAGYNVPVVAIRDGMPWDQPGVSYANDELTSFDTALKVWQRWRKTAEFTDEDRIEQYAVAKTLKLPVINMSYGGGLFDRAVDAGDNLRVIVSQPAELEALGRVLSGGQVLGVAAAGNHHEAYGTGSKVRGNRPFAIGNEHGIQQPCGISLTGHFKPWIAKPDPKNPKAVIAEHEWTPGINWGSLDLICVASTTSMDHALARSSGSGDAAVAMAAPGQDVTVATRPPEDAPDGQNAYRVGSGTSYAAPVVAGAAALLRRAAPGASMNVIRQALEQGARMTLNLRGKVRYGQLDVACSLRWLDRRRQPDWRLIPISAAQDPKAYVDFISATSACGGQRPPLVTEPNLVEVTKSELVKGFKESSVGAFLKSVNSDYTDRNSAARRWQDLLLAESGVHAGGVGTAFPVGPAAFATPLTLNGLARPAEVYEAGLISAGCPASYAISGIDVSVRMRVRPPAWVFPTDAEPPPRRIELAVAVGKPWYWRFVDNTIKVRVRATCQYYPQVTQ